ncbi:hypothetical protein FGIG_07281 [Fasciola gigantica]|uniref:DUF5743 domain-containing protein n=1 Tax=Fasciola gigantica TaxID=46835 RepID=A0A504Z4S6_FASGI|nr:hypothetical protein FGIG_07281 [Fasciola gigantica]
MMNLGSISDQLPTYPNNIQGELRIILQTKDVFLVCYKHLEEYRRLVNEQNRLITKEFVQEQLQIGEDEITELKMELQDAESRLGVRLRHNELLADHLASLGCASLESGGSVRHLALCRSPQMRKNMLAQRQGSAALSTASESRPPTHMIDNIALAIAEIHQEVRSKVKPLLDYYRDLFYLQLHFSLVLGQVCNYCMPLVTENIGLIDRIFFWSERPEFDLVRRAGDIGDRLKEIYTRAQTVLSVLAESVRFLQSKVELQKTLEQRFHERLDEQQKTKDKILREVHTTKQNMDMLEEENDRLVGSLVKVDPSFVDSRHFYELAEGGTLMGAKKPNMKETAQNNAEDKQEMMSNSSPAAARMDMADDLEKDNRTRVNARRNNDMCSPSSMDNPSGEMNNNKALSVLSDAPAKILEAKPKGRKKASKEEMDELLQDIKTKMNLNTKKSPGDTNKPVNMNNVSEASGAVSVITDASVSGNESRMGFDRATPLQKQVKRATSRARSKSRKRDVSLERSRQSPPREQRHKPVRRATSVDKERKKPKLKKHRPKSTLGGARLRNSDELPKREQRVITPEHKVEELRPSSISTAAGDIEIAQGQPQTSLKSKLLGRTKDLLEAALNRSPKSSSTEQVTRTIGDPDSSLATGRLDQDELNNDGVTSVSSFASLLVADSPLGEPTFIPPSNVSTSKQLRTLEPRKKGRNITDPSKTPPRKNRLSRRGKSQILDYESQPLPNLSSDMLLTESPTTVQSALNAPVFGTTATGSTSGSKRSRTRRGMNGTDNDLSSFLAGTSLGPAPSLTTPQSALPSVL